ncbi:MAG: bifunctional UDP-N-acetylglucosamine diphosphorylase/glucosamine-1-phosphate N-acetyltransferase GlmU [Succinivibrionaceae bacterium]|nr:bifunctional UDP-N-acetylglucosamine diphosphorylase/glucosamine-1-phosphate N-acetyltransferase GlmU [Succinivibrionaceae bacterium]
MPLNVVILAAGMGKRMRSRLPKVLHTLAGTPLLFHVIKAAAALDPERIVVVTGHGGAAVREALAQLPPALGARVATAEQREQLGTAHAVGTALPQVGEGATVLVLYGDTPLTPPGDLRALLEALPSGGMSLLTADCPAPHGYGRIVRGAGGTVQRIVEEKDASEAERAIHEVNTGMIAASAATLREFLPQIGNQNAQGEYYLTDLVGLLASQGRGVAAVKAPDFAALGGVNDNAQLAAMERLFQRRAAEGLLAAGVTLADPARLDVRGTLSCGQDVFIDINVVIEGEVTLGDNVTVGPGCVLKDCSIGAGSVISPYTVIEGSRLGRNNTIGPFARLRPGNEFADTVHVGDFVECKKARLGEGTKAGHLSYLGDAELGRNVNVGAGTITCNYDGANKHRTVIGDDVFIGSDTQLVAPVTVRDGATIGAGTTVTREIPEGALAINHRSVDLRAGYERPSKK